MGSLVLKLNREIIFTYLKKDLNGQFTLEDHVIKVDILKYRNQKIGYILCEEDVVLHYFNPCHGPVRSIEELVSYSAKHLSTQDMWTHGNFNGERIFPSYMKNIFFGDIINIWYVHNILKSEWLQRFKESPFRHSKIYQYGKYPLESLGLHNVDRIHN